MPSLSFHDKQHILRLLQQQGQVKYVFDKFVREIGAILTKWAEVDGNNVWLRNTTLERQIDKLLVQLHDDLLSNIDSATAAAWKGSNIKNDDLVNSFIKDLAIPEAVRNGMFVRNMEALKALSNQKTNGLTVSGRVWKITEGAKTNLEYYLSSGISTGRAAATISQDIRQLLQNPDRRFRRVRNEEGKLVPSKPMQDYQPGRGVYRSSYKNALRMAATQTNIAYRTADYERWQTLDFVLGIEVMRSPSNRGPCPLCDSMKGKYPKDFKFIGWHPWCICQAVPIMLEGEQFTDYLISGKIPDDMAIDSIPTSAKAYVNAKKEHNNSLFIAENKKFFSQDNDNIIGKVKGNALIFDSKSKEIAGKMGITVTDVNIKSDKRIIEKAQNDYNGDVSRVKDIIRNTFISGSDNNDALLHEISKAFEIDNVKIQSSQSDPLGYSGILVNVELKKGIFAEIQINSAQMIYGKDVRPRTIIGNTTYNKIKRFSGLEPGLGHKYYEEWRMLHRDIPQELKRMKELEDLSKAYYNALRSIKL